MNKKDSSEGKMAEAIERPKMPRATWDALRAHIIRERARKKQEIEQTQEFERQKKERERKKKQEKLSLEDTKEQIAQLETRLAKFKEEKHQLFHTLKKVLLEDQSRRRKPEPHPSHVYLQPSVRQSPLFMKPHPHLFMPPHHNSSGSPIPPSSSPASQHNTPSATVVTTAAIPPAKRQRSPSPTSSRSAHSGHPTPGFPGSVRNPSQGSSSSYHSSLGRPPSTGGYPTSNPNFTHANSTSVNSPAVSVTGSAGLAAAVAAAAAHYPYTTSAARSVAMAAVASAEEERSKQLYAAAAVASQNARTYDRERAALVAAAAQRLPLATPPAAHGTSATTLTQVYRGSSGSIMSGYPRFPSASPTPGRNSPPRVPSQPPNGAPNPRYYSALQRDV